MTLEKSIKCHYAECHYVEFRGANYGILNIHILGLLITPNSMFQYEVHCIFDRKNPIQHHNLKKKDSHISVLSNK
jgi:hypothetical protein